MKFVKIDSHDLGMILLSFNIFFTLTLLCVLLEITFAIVTRFGLFLVINYIIEMN